MFIFLNIYSKYKYEYNQYFENNINIFKYLLI